MPDYSILGFNYCELYVSKAKQVAHYYQSAFGFQPIAFQGLVSGSIDKALFESIEREQSLRGNL